MLIAGLVCLALAAAAAGYAYWRHRKLAAVEPSSCGDMRQMADAVAVSEGAGGFRQRCELTGTAQPAYAGIVQAPQSKKECVWYRTKVTHESKSEVVSDETSDIPFALDDGTGQAVIHPEDADIHEPVKTFDEFESDGETSGYQREEWILPVGMRLFVQGELTDEDGHLRLRKPERGTFRVSTTSAAEPPEPVETGRRLGTIGAGALAAIGVALVIAGLVA